MRQGDFAEALGVGQPVVSAWEQERGGYEPSPESYAHLGNFASERGFFGEAIWFWQRAGMDPVEMSRALRSKKKSVKERSAAVGTVLVEVMPNIVGQEESETAPALGFDESVVPNPDCTRYLRVPTESFVPRMLHVGDLVVIDSSETDPWKLEGSLIAAYRSPELRDERTQREFEKSNTEEEVNERRKLGIHPFQRFGLFVGRLQAQRVENNAHLYLTELSREGVEVQELVASWTDYYLRRDPADRGGPDKKILGRVLSLFPSQMNDLLANKSPKRRER